MRRVLFLLGVCLFLTGVTGLSSERVVLVRDGVPAAQIILEAKPSRSAQMAAYELQHVLKLMTGAVLPMGTQRQAGLLPVYVGGAEPGEFIREQYSVSVRKDRIRLAGNDTPDFGKVDYQDARTFPGTGYNWRNYRRIYNFHSSMYAVYEFLEQCLQVRFYEFGDLGIALQKKSTVWVNAPLELRKEPRAEAFRYAGLVYRNSRKHSERDRLLLQLRWRMNTLYGQTNHTTSSLLPRFWGKARGAEHLFIEKRRDYFISGYEKMPVDVLREKRFDRNDPPPAQLCTSNPEVAEFFAREAASVYRGGAFIRKDRLEEVRFRFMKQMPGFQFYYPVQEDDNNYWCRCERCLRLFPEIKGAERHAYLHFDFINRVQQAVKKLEPDMNLSTLAYNMALRRPDPAVLKLAPGYAVQICLGIHSWVHPYVYERQHGIYKEWIRTEGKRRPLTVWIYMLSPESDACTSYRYNHFFPVRYPWKTVEICREFMQDGVRGIFLEVSARRNLLEGYLAMKTAFDPEFDAEKVIDEYFTLYYGRAAAPMKEFFRLNQEITWNAANYPAKELEPLLRRWKHSSVYNGLHRQNINWSLGTHERMERLQKLVDQAGKLADNDLIRKRLQIFMEDVWTPAVRGRKEYDQRLEAEKNPPPGMTAACFASDLNEEGKLFPEGFRHTSPWIDLRTRKAVVEELSPKMRAICTEKHLILCFEENAAGGSAGAAPDFWSDNVEIFFGRKAAYPFYQLAVGRQEKWEGYYHEEKDGVRSFRKWCPEGVRVQKVRQEGRTWSWRLYIPWKAADLRKEPFIRMNFIRNRPGGLAPLAWSYLEPSGYAAGIYRMGFLHLPQPAAKGSFSVNPGFTRRNSRGEPSQWMQNVPDGKSPRWTCKDGRLTLDGGKGLVHYMTLVTKTLRYRDRLVVRFTACGTGTGLAGQYLYSSWNTTDRWRWRTAQTKEFKVTAEKKQYRMVIDTAELKPEFSDILAFRPFLGVKPGAKITFSDIVFEFE